MPSRVRTDGRVLGRTRAWQVVILLVAVGALVGVYLVLQSTAKPAPGAGKTPGNDPVTTTSSAPTEPASSARSSSASPAQQVFRHPVNKQKVLQYGNRWLVQTPGKPYSMYLSPTYDRFELRAGDAWPKDLGPRHNVTRNRAELAGPHLPYDTGLWMSWSIRIPSGTHLSPHETVVGQLHSTPDKEDKVSRHPVMAFRLIGSEGKYNIQTRSDPNRASTVVPENVTRYNGPALKKGVWHHVVVSMRFSRTGTGYLFIWLDGKEIVKLPKIPFGYNDAAGPYWKFGNYHPAFNETNVIEWANMEVGKKPLTARIKSPLPVGGPH